MVQICFTVEWIYCKIIAYEQQATMVAKLLARWEMFFWGILRSQRVLLSEKPMNPQNPISIVNI